VKTQATSKRSHHGSKTPAAVGRKLPVRRRPHGEGAIINPDFQNVPGVGRRALRLRIVLAKVGLRKSALWDKIKLGLFPAPVYPYGPRTPLWDERVVDAWLDAAFASPDQQVAG
jgi:predicted DNA-binding transcriptional regulator AlpA